MCEQHPHTRKHNNSENFDTKAKFVFTNGGYVHATLNQAILRAKKIGCARFILGDVTDGYVDESADNKYLNIAEFKRELTTEIEIEKIYKLCSVR